ncbi:hypothetical protein M426DRAFT_262347 [Hypoxylon sp. CI-4A]|nr:hypothetical protein M426DRAFT_262347 [Hypoxylon sp. CI-4A]
MRFDEHIYDGETTTIYVPLAKDEESLSDQGTEDSALEKGMKKSPFVSAARTSLLITSTAVIILILFLILTAGILKTTGPHKTTALRIPLPNIQKEFMNHSPFAQEPPKGAGAGHHSEPIWDALIPEGLGYFKDEELAPEISIPTVMHQLHCLYVLRRAYYSQSDDLEAFDFGKDRPAHVAHCFDYLVQSITCAADSTVEPAEHTNGFLGSGFPRQCRDFGALKEFVGERRAFNASGFLAHGLKNGHIQIGGTG